ncbi:adenylyl-sulfate kinase [Streptomyces violaceus]|uniref:adenylyl-sulfate kinase n=1 Tax=Streptomyces violaceus TaxID=1936 RepID=UPI0018765365
MLARCDSTATELPNSGKTTIARTIAARLREEHRRVETLDGDEILRANPRRHRRPGGSRGGVLC